MFVFGCICEYGCMAGSAFMVVSLCTDCMCEYGICVCMVVFAYIYAGWDIFMGEICCG